MRAIGWIAMAGGLAVVAVGCQTPPPAPNGTAAGGWTLEVTTPDLSVNAPQRFEVILAQDRETGTLPVVFGTVQLAFAYLGSDGAGVPAPRRSVTARYLPVPGTPAVGAGPVRSDPGAARGAYVADDQMFDSVGIWSVTATAGLTGGAGPVRVSATFPVDSTPAFPAVGQHAIPVDNPTIGSDAPRAQIDSRAIGGKPIPDPELHRWSVRAALAAHRAILLLFSTPAYCKSQVCGPDTDEMARLAKRYADRAIFIHVEVWQKFGSAALSPAATPWLLHNGILNEPWLYLIDARGTIVDRWPPLLFDWKQVAAELKALPKQAVRKATR